LTPVKTPMAKDVIYTCPMHPQIRQIGPGNCPICGMTLEPVIPTENTNENEELKDLTQKLWVGAILTIPVFLISMGGRHFLTSIFTHTQMSWAEFILSTPVVLWCGWPLLKKGYQSVINKSLNMFSLISLGIGTAYLYSAVAVLFPNIFPNSFRQMNGEVSVYFEAAAVM
jgi:Cu+-exporting ATPase